MARPKKEAQVQCEHVQEEAPKTLKFTCNVFHNGVEYKKGQEYLGEPSEELKKFLE